tara:strand:+ start:49 stop:501 length:453 start_codon:yes stop_codon:yes gene_type:complete
MAGFYSGKEGELLIDDTKVARVRSWSFSFNQSVLETVSLEDTDRTIVNGIRSYTGNASIYYYQESAGSGSGPLSQLMNNIIKAAGNPGENGTSEAVSMKFRLRIKDGSANGRFIQFQGIVTSFNMTSTVGEVTAGDITFEVNGAPTGFVF